MSDRFEVVQEDEANVGLAPEIGHLADRGGLSNQRWTFFGDAILVLPPLPSKHQRLPRIEAQRNG
jgi:hypothetical protein